jgi:D-3-phosphoglycerate dehydrogenase
MNIDTLLKEKKITVEVQKITKRINYETLIKMTVSGEGEKSVISGTVFSERPKIVEIDDQYMDVEPSEFMLVLKSIDRPGVIGMVGSFLGKNGINIAGWQLGRKSVGGDALSVLTLDQMVSAEILKELKKLENIVEAYPIQI